MICKKCGKDHNGSYGSGQFCSKECARSYATLNEKNKHQLKEAKCINCGKIIYIDKRASLKTCKCKECSKRQFKCNICGRIYNEDDCHCTNEFCKKHTYKQFKSLIKYFGFNETKLGTCEVEDEFNKIKNTIYDLYWNKLMSFSDIAKIYNYKSNPGNLSNIFEYLEIPIRSFTDSTILTILQRKQKSKSIWHTTWNNKEVYLRSSYELDYAKKLDKQQIDYEVEYFHIKYWDSQKQKYRCAIPDFYIPSTNTIVEIKSSWTLDEQNMKDKMKAYKEFGYNTNLICDHKEINL